MNDEDAYGENAYGSPEDLLRQIEWIRLAMLGAQKELGALAESMRESLAQPWPELFDQLAELQALLADLRAELRFYHRTSLGQLPIAPCFPPRAEPQYMHLGLGDALGRLCQ
ncbi:MAG TPA: hypothetical protein VFW96_29525, partial [Thermomicrobiales bacterium]|nr:hypothetical protein [Thermomicrobiales bacterium]